jgi:hypothetical protein
MAGKGNFCAMRAAGLTRVAHQRKPLTKWAIFLALAAVWLWFGLRPSEPEPMADTIYRMLAALTVGGNFENAAGQGDADRGIARFAGVALTAVGLLFGFSGAVGRAFARLWMLGAGDHVVIAGEGPAALALARSCRKEGDAVVLIARDLAPETGWSLRQNGIVLIEGDPAHQDALRSARAGHASHAVALTGDDAENLRIEAALRAVTPPKRRRTLAAHVAIAAPLLLMEAREMRMLAQREFDGLDEAARRKARPPALDPRSFSLAEIAARGLIARHAEEILDLADKQGRERLHIVVFGFDATAEAVTVRALMSLWSARFGAPRVTVVAADAAAAADGFAARYPQAQAHDVWRADIAFVSFDWTRASLDGGFLDRLDGERGPPAAVIVSTGSDAENIQLALGLMRTANMRQMWAAPIFMKESTESEFSRQFASGDKTAALDAYVQAFGAVEAVATRDFIVEGVLDRGAAIAHSIYDRRMARSEVDMRTLEAVGRTWGQVPETYRNANRAAVDSALVKLWDAGWRPARAGEKFGEVNPPVDPETVMRLAEVEHARWMAERLISGWRPAAPGRRDNRLMMHDNLTPWSALDAELRERDADQVRVAAKAARALCPRGFVRRD